MQGFRRWVIGDSSDGAQSFDTSFAETTSNDVPPAPDQASAGLGGQAAPTDSDLSSFGAVQTGGAQPVTTGLTINGTLPPQPLGDSNSSTGAAGLTGSGTTMTGNLTGSGFGQETVTTAGSGLVFINTYDASVAADYHAAIIAAEHDLASHYTNSVTIRASFGFQNLGGGFAAENFFSNTVTVDYGTLRAALISHAVNSADLAALNNLPLTAPSNSHSNSASTGFLITAGLARILGLEGAGSTVDDRIVLGSGLTWNFDPNNRGAAGGFDAVGALEHELSEGGLGRVGGLGYQNNIWGPEDLFRFNSSGVHDYTGGQDGVTTYFSPDGNNLDFSRPFHSSVNTSGVFDGFDPGDWDASGDSFGVADVGTIDPLSSTDDSLMQVLGWVPPPPSPPPPPPPPPPAPTNTAVWLMNGLNSSGGLTTQQLGADWQPVVTGDFDGNGTSDVLWRNVNSGQTAIWFMSGTQSSGVATTQQLGPDWHVIATGDFNGDGKTDVVWRNANTFHTAVWLMNGAQASGSETTQQLGSDWQLIGTGDFNGDGHSDLLWRNTNSGQTAIWFMNGNNASGAVTTQQLGLDWQIVGTGDFDGNGRTDILWHNNNTGQTAIWFMNGTNASGVLTDQQLGTDWHIIGVGDFNGDHRSDILWRNDDGTTAIWFMNGMHASGGLTQQQLGADWRPVTTGDFNGDGRSDIFFRDDGISGMFPIGWNNFTQHYNIL